MDIEERRATWKFIIAFLLGAIFAELTADPISDYLFFKRESSNVPFQPWEAVFYWYYLPGLVYMALLVLAVVLWRTKTVSARVFIYFLLFLAGLGFIFSVKTLGGDQLSTVMLILPVVLLAFTLLFRVRLND